VKFTVHGADVKTGDEHSIIISAENPSDAELKARSMGLVISSVGIRENELSPDELAMEALSSAPEPTVKRAREPCENCGGLIGALERTTVFDGHTVCHECGERLVHQYAPSAAGRSNAKDTALFMAEGVTITRQCVSGQGRRVPTSQVFSVRSEARFLGGMIVDVIDVVRSTYRFKFRNADNARGFIAALTQVKGTLNIERDASFFWFFWW